MMAPTVISNLVTNSDRALESAKRKEKRRLLRATAARDQARATSNGSSLWKSEAQQQVYSSKLLQAIRQVRLGSGLTVPRRGRAVREAADRALAVTAKGKTRWSRAIFTSRLKLKCLKTKRPRAATTGAGRSKRPRVSILRLRSKNIPAVQRRVRVLGRLVPGCRKEALPVILEEATDYIPALEMQVRAMNALVELLSGSGSISSGVAHSQQLGSSRPPPS